MLHRWECTVRWIGAGQFVSEYAGSWVRLNANGLAILIWKQYFGARQCFGALCRVYSTNNNIRRMLTLQYHGSLSMTKMALYVVNRWGVYTSWYNSCLCPNLKTKNGVSYLLQPEWDYWHLKCLWCYIGCAVSLDILYLARVHWIKCNIRENVLKWVQSVLYNMWFQFCWCHYVFVHLWGELK